MLNVIKEELINVEYFYFDIESYSFFRQFEVVGKNIWQQICLYVLSYSSPFPCKDPQWNLHLLRKMSARKHNGRANSEIGYLILNFWGPAVFLSIVTFFELCIIISFITKNILRKSIMMLYQEGGNYFPKLKLLFWGIFNFCHWLVRSEKHM